MSHTFHKTANNTSGVPSRLSSYDRLVKKAHDVWEIIAEGDEIVGQRKKNDDVELHHKHEEMDHRPMEGEIVLLLLGGRQVQARVLAEHDTGYSVVTEDGYYDDVPLENLAIVAQQGPVPTNEIPRSQRPTREDIPVQNDPNQAPEQEAPAMADNETVQNIESLLQKNGGHVAIQIAPSNILEITQTDQGIFARLLYTSVEIAHQGNYQNVGHLVQNLNLSGWYSEAPMPKVK